MATPNYDINYDDKRFTAVTDEKTEALSDLEQMYGKQNPDGTYTGGLIGQSNAMFDQQIKDVEAIGETQKKNQQAQSDFAIQQIERERGYAQQDYIKEQSGAYVDWQKQSNKYGANAEAMAAQGLQNTGYSESSQVAMYNQYQNRVTVARESWVRADTEFVNAMNEARLQNDAVLAEIAINTLREKNELIVQKFAQQNTLVLDKADRKQKLDEMYHQRWQDVLAQINEENKLKETVRQHEDDVAYRNAQLRLERDKFTWQKEQANKTSGGTVRGYKGTTLKDYHTTANTGGTVKNDDTKETVKGNNEPTVDMKSVLDLGYGPISAKQLDDLIRQGKVREYESGGKIKYEKIVTMRRFGR